MFYNRLTLENKRLLLFCFAFFAAVKLASTFFFYTYICPPLAPLDDNLMFTAAVNIASGSWLGTYGPLTMAKHMGFAVWLALLHVLHIPYLFGGQLLWVGASAFTVAAFAPRLNSGTAKFTLYMVLLFNPAAMATFTFRIYRDNIFPAICLFVFSGVVGFALRYRQQVLKGLPFIATSGLFFGFALLCREDGIWLLPFIIAGSGIALCCIWFGGAGGRLAKTAAFILPLCLCVAVVFAYCGMNYKYYGRFIISDFSGAEFEDAMGALMRPEHENWEMIVSVPAEVREKLYPLSPAFKELQPYLEDSAFLNGYGDTNTKKIPAGAFYWVLRAAAAAAGHYGSPGEAQAYFTRLAEEVNAACDAGLLPAGAKRSATTSPIKAAYILPVAKEAVSSFFAVLTFRQTVPVATLAVGRPDEIQPVETFLYTRGATAAKPNTAEVYLSPLRMLVYGGYTVISWVYALCTPVFFVLALGGLCKQAAKAVKRQAGEEETLLLIVVLGLLGMAVLRCFMVAFVEVSAFGIGTYVMYLATVHPLLLLVCFFGTGFLLGKRGATVKWKRR